MLLAAALALTPTRTIPEFDPIELVARYRAYRLPEPPLNATPVDGFEDGLFDLPGFAVPGKAGVIYRPWEPYRMQQLEHWKIEPLATAKFTDMRGDDALWPTIAILESRGREDLVQRVLKAVFVDDKFDNDEYRSPWQPLRRRAWAYWRARAIEHPRERAELLRWLKTWSKIDALSPSKEETSFLKDLAATLAPPPRPQHPNRFDKLIEQARTSTGLALSDQKYGPWSGYGIEDGDAAADSIAAIAKPIRRLWEAGFDAVPTMFRYLDDRQITLLGRENPAATPEDADDFGSRTIRYHRVCDIAADEITTALGVGPDFYSTRPREWDGDQGEDAPDAQIARVKAMWPKWLAAKKTGELKLLLKQMAEDDEEEKGALDTVSTDGARAYPLRVLAIKYRSALVKFLHHVKFEHERDQIEEALDATGGAKR